MSNSKPNILFVLVDEMRYPTNFPEGIADAPEFFERYMPNIYKLWKRGVKFSNYHTAANACSPARGTIISGLYSQQTGVGCTNTQVPTQPPYDHERGFDPSIAPTLDPAFPTYGKLLRDLGYRLYHELSRNIKSSSSGCPVFGLRIMI